MLFLVVKKGKIYICVIYIYFKWKHLVFGGVKRLGRGGKISMLWLIVFDLCKMLFVFYSLKIGYSPFCACASFVYIFCFDLH